MRKRAQGRRPTLGAAVADRASRLRQIRRFWDEHLFAASKRAALACAIALIMLAPSTPTFASVYDGCSLDMQYHLGMAVDFYKEWETYSNESDDTSDQLASAEWQNFAHEIDWINDHGHVDECNNRKILIIYYLYSARKDESDAINDHDDPALIGDEVEVFYLDVEELYRNGYAQIDPIEYGYLKQQVKNWFAREHKPFKSWEKP